MNTNAKSNLTRNIAVALLLCMGATSASAGIDCWTRNPITGAWEYTNTKSNITTTCNAAATVCTGKSTEAK